MDAAIRRLVARAEIRDVLMRYCRGLDRMDRQLASSVWHTGATVDYLGLFAGTAEGFLDWVWDAHAPYESHAHQITNVLIEVDDETATSEASVTVVIRGPLTANGRKMHVTIGRYLDRWAYRNGRWAIDHRVHVMDLPRLVGEQAADALRFSARDRSDPSYDVLGW